jgi:predicted AlkP superfamily pyrophosphatase or phosphodiesterase
MQEPESSDASVIDSVVEASRKALGGGRVEKMLVYAPDALGEWIYRENRRLYAGVKKMAPIEVEMRSVMPSKTPVCYASMFTGAPPKVHGITQYEKPVLTCDTLFDVLVRAKKKAAIVAVEGSSIDIIFRKRKIDYYTEKYDPQVEARVLELLEAKDYDFILAYHQEYDDLMHDSTPRDAKALEAFRRHLKSFETLATAFNERYASKNRAVVFTPDHGTHVDAESGKGTHGWDIPEDMEVRHFWGISRGG